MTTKADNILKAVRSVLESGLDELTEDVTPHMVSAFAARGIDVGESFTGRDLEKVIRPHAVQYARNRAGELVTELADTSEEMLRSTIEKAVEKGWPPGKLARELQGNFAFSRERAVRIARTEAAIAERRGGQLAASEIGIRAKRWFAGSEACEPCKVNGDAGWIALDADWPKTDIPHPNCLCDVEYSMREVFAGNPYHDKKGRFTWGSGSGASGKWVFNRVDKGATWDEAAKASQGIASGKIKPPAMAGEPGEYSDAVPLAQIHSVYKEAADRSPGAKEVLDRLGPHHVRNVQLYQGGEDSENTRDLVQKIASGEIEEPDEGTYEGRTLTAARMIYSALDKLNDYEGKAFRGVSFKDNKQLQEFMASQGIEAGKDIGVSFFSAFSKSEEVAKSFASNAVVGGRGAQRNFGVMFEVDSKKAKHTDQVSDNSFHRLQEVTYLPGTKFRVDSIVKTQAVGHPNWENPSDVRSTKASMKPWTLWRVKLSEH